MEDTMFQHLIQLGYYNDRISGYEISSVTNVNNYSEPGNWLINDGQKWYECQ